MKLTEASKEKYERFANGRVSASYAMRGRDFAEAMSLGYRWFPRVSGENFKPSNGIGFLTKQDAISDAKRIREACRAVLEASNG